MKVVGREPIMMRSLVVDMNHFEAVKEKIKIIKRLMESPDKARLDEDYRQLLVCIILIRIASILLRKALCNTITKLLL